MLQTMRHLAQSWLFKGLMMILIVSFGIWGIGDIFRGNPMQRTVATVGDESITVQDLGREFKTALAEMRRSYMSDLTEQQAKRYGIMDKVLEEMIARKQLLQESQRMGIDITEHATLDWFAARPQFRNKDGSFNKELFHQAAAKENLSDGEFIVKWQGLIEQRELLYPLINNDKIPQTIVDAVAQARAQKRVLNIVKLANDSMRDIPTPDDKTLRSFYDKNPKDFTAPEYRAFTIARLSTADLEKDIVITDEQARKEYDSHLELYLHPERRDIVQVVVQDEEKAKQLASAAHSSGDLTKTAANMGLKGIPINQADNKNLLPELVQPVFDLKQDQVSDPVKSSLGWHVIQLKKVTPPGTTPFDAIKDELLATMKRDQSADAAARAVNQLDDELAAGHPLEDIADTLRLRLIKIPELDATGKMPDDKDPPELPSKDDVMKAAFGQAAGETSPVIDDKEGNYIVVRTDQLIPSALRPFDKVKNQIIAAWKAQEQATRAAAQAESIAKALRGGKTPSSFAGQSGVEVSMSKPISLVGDADPSIPASVLPQIAKMKKGDVITAVVPGHQLILRLAEFVSPDATTFKTVKTKVSADVSHHMGDELIDEYKQYMGDVFPPKINHEVLESMRQQGTG